MLEIAADNIERPSNRVRIVVMVDREHEALLYRVGKGKITRGMDIIFETLRLYQENEKGKKRS
jgi:hypothetical protein